MDDDLPQLVRDYKLKTSYEYEGNVAITVHEHDDPEAPLSSPPRQERWRKVGTLGQGGQGSIVLEKCTAGSRHFTERAVKKIWFQNDDTKRRYQRELETMIMFSHEKYSRHLIKTLGWFTSSKKLYIAMEYFPEGDLYSYAQQNPYLAEDDGCQIAIQLLLGLSFLHDEGFSHRDLKPQNILIQQHPKMIPSKSWWVKLADFGISKKTDTDASLTSISIGTAAYMAPELCQYDDPSSPQDFRPADVWALATTIFFILTNSLPFQGKASTVAYANNHGQPFPHRSLDACHVSQSGQAFIQHAMAPQPETRLALNQAMRHPWIESMLPSPRVPTTQTSRPSTISSKRSSFDYGRGNTIEISDLVTRLSFETPQDTDRDTELQETETSILDQEGNAWAQLLTAVHNGNIDTVETLLEVYDTKTMPLSLSAHDQEASLARLLYDLPMGRLNVKNGAGCTPILLAAIKGHIPLTELLISAGADPEDVDSSCKTALHHAVLNHQEPVVRLLLENRVNIEAKDAGGLTPLLEAAKKGYTSIAGLLIDNGADIEARDKAGVTPLICAADWGYEGTIELLLKRDANIEAKDRSGFTPLSRAAHTGKVAVVRLLLGRGAEREAKDNNGRTPLMLSTTERSEDAMLLLLSHGAKIEAKDNAGFTPLVHAVRSGQGPTVKLLLQRRANIETKDLNGSTPLILAVELGAISVVHVLLDHGANIRARDRRGKTPLKIAAKRKDRATEKLLREPRA